MRRTCTSFLMVVKHVNVFWSSRRERSHIENMMLGDWGTPQQVGSSSIYAHRTTTCEFTIFDYAPLGMGKRVFVFFVRENINDRRK